MVKRWGVAEGQPTDHLSRPSVALGAGHQVEAPWGWLWGQRRHGSVRVACQWSRVGDWGHHRSRQICGRVGDIRQRAVPPRLL